MAASLNKFAVLAVLWVAGNAAAEALPDPTRPAEEWSALYPGAGGSGGAAKPGAADEGLRTIIIAPDRRSAVINGIQVPLGGKLGDERLMAVCDDSVVLAGAEGKREIKLYPGVDIRSAGQKRCTTPEAGRLPEAGQAPGKKLNKAQYKNRRGVTAKERKVCK